MVVRAGENGSYAVTASMHRRLTSASRYSHFFLDAGRAAQHHRIEASWQTVLRELQLRLRLDRIGIGLNRPAGSGERGPMAPTPRPFTVGVPDSDINELRLRLAKTRLPDQAPDAPLANHFAALEQPEALARDVQHFFRPLRSNF